MARMSSFLTKLQMPSDHHFRSLHANIHHPLKILHLIAHKLNNAQRLIRISQIKVTSSYPHEKVRSSQSLRSTAEPTASTEASQTRRRLKREEATERSPNPIESKTYGSVAVEIPMKKSTINSKRSAPDGENAEQPTKRAKVNKLHSARSLPLSNSPAISEPDVEHSAIKKPSSAMKKDTKRKKERPPESDDDDHPLKKPAPKRARFVEESKPLYVLFQIWF